MGARTHPSRAAAAALVLLTALAGGGCSGDDASESSSSSSGTAAPSPTAEKSPTAERDAGTVLAVTVRGDTVDPRGKRVQVAAGERLTLAIDSDTEGEIHVHATPETTLAFGPGTSRRQLLLEQPGVVEVELHEPTEVTVFQLEVR